MGFVKSLEAILAGRNETADFHDAEMLVVLWETRPEIVRRLLPAPLKPAGAPIATAFVADYPSTNFAVTYRESALFCGRGPGAALGHECEPGPGGRSGFL